MDNLGRAIYMACFALMFIFAASISLYLYGTLEEYLDKAADATGMVNRTEGVANENLSNFKRDISVAEIYITLYNMQQMHVTSLKVGGYTITPEMVKEKNGSYNDVLYFLENNKNTKFNYSYKILKDADDSYLGTTVTYTKISI